MFDQGLFQLRDRQNPTRILDLTRVGTVNAANVVLRNEDGDVVDLSVLPAWDESGRLKVNPIVNEAGVSANAGQVGSRTQRVVQAYNTEWTTLRANYTAAQTDTAIVTASAGQRIVVKKVAVTADKANTVDVASRVGFGTASTPSTTGVLESHPGIAAGSGDSEYLGSDGITGQDGEDVRITSEVPTSGSIDVVIAYKIIPT